MRAFDNKKKWDSLENWRKTNTIPILDMVSQKNWEKKDREVRSGWGVKKKKREGLAEGQRDMGVMWNHNTMKQGLGKL